MDNKYQTGFYAALIGIILGAIGVHVMGYVAAVVIPVDFLFWFENEALASAAISFVSQFLGFGILAILLGLIVGRLSRQWLLNSVICYAAFVFYLSVGSALVYGGGITNPFAGLQSSDFFSFLIVPVCLLLATSLASKKHSLLS